MARTLTIHSVLQGPAARLEGPLASERALRHLATAVAEGRPLDEVSALADRVAALAPTADGRPAVLEAERLLSVAISNASERERLLRLASTDPLTGLSNRRAFRDELAAEHVRAVRHGRRLTLAMVDIDRFKRINDTWGHDAGDAVLSAFALALARCARAGDVVGRVGGEEFAWLMPETRLEDAGPAVERARAAARDIRIARLRGITFSCGIADLSHAADAEALLRHADQALYAAKDMGRDRTVRFNPGPQRTPRARPGGPLA